MGTWNRNQICQEIRVEEDLEVLSGRFFHLVELRECTRERGPEVNAVSRAGSPCFCVTGHLNQMARFPEPAWLHDRNREINNGTRLEFLLLLSFSLTAFFTSNSAFSRCSSAVKTYNAQKSPIITAIVMATFCTAAATSLIFSRGHCIRDFFSARASIRGYLLSLLRFPLHHRKAVSAICVA